MGWSFTYGSPQPSIKAEIDKLHTWESDGVKVEVIKSTMVGSTYYAAVRRTHADGKTDTTASVCLTKRINNKSFHEWGYKGMDETMGPSESRCPVSILKLLDPPPNEFSRQWRERCREYAAQPKREYKAGTLISQGEDHTYRLERPHSWRTRTWVVSHTKTGQEYRMSLNQMARYAIVQPETQA